MISQKTIEEIKQKANLIEVIAEYVKLKARGKNYIGLCPFHAEKTPSFTVSPEKEMFHCFGCGVGGNLFTFIMKIEKADFSSAAEILAKKLGINVIYTKTSGISKTEKEKIIKLNELALAFFVAQLDADSGKAAREYLVKRKISAQTVKTFEIGYAPDTWDSLYRYLIARGADPQIILAAGLAIKKEAGEGCFDRFRHRLIFPIKDLNGKVCGFGSRVIGAGEPKYLNSPDTIVYNKSEILYGLNLAKENIKAASAAALVEGYLDLIACFSAGITFACATLGTALTTQHAKLLKRFADKVILCFDSDPAGENAAERSSEILRSLDFSVKIADLSPHKDPDELLKAEGAAALNTRLKAAVSYMQFKLKAIAARHNLKDLEEKARAAYEAARTIAKEPNQILQSEYAKEAALLFDVDFNTLTGEIKKASFYGGTQNKKHNPKITLKPKSKLAEAEKIILRLSLSHARFFEQIKLQLSPEDFSTTAAQEIITVLLSLPAEEEKNEKALFDKLTSEEAKSLLSELAVYEDAGSETEEIFHDCLRVIRTHKLQSQIESLKQKIAAAEKGGEITAVKKLHEQYTSLCSQRHGANLA